MTMQTDLQAAVDKASAASGKLHAIIHGDAVSTVETENGPVKTVAKVIADNETAIAGSRAELDQKVADAAGSAQAAAGSADAAAGSAATATERAAKIPDPAPEHALQGIRVNGTGDAYELYPGGGDVNGPASAADGELIRFNGATGKLIKSGGQIATADIAENAVTLAKLAPGTPDSFIGFDAAGAPVEKEVPPIDLSSRVAKTGDSMAGTLEGPQFKTSASTSAATGFKIADGTDLAALFAVAGNVLTDATGSGAGYGPVHRVTSVSLYKSGTTAVLSVGTACNCDCNCNC
ncbi:MAG: hypothetical protein HQL43_07055 [Alphaproteobacteria bacterium]|nr:hypothetical protein [Alphaproteobacteria bacterium]